MAAWRLVHPTAVRTCLGATPLAAQAVVPPGSEPVCLALETEDDGDISSIDLPGRKLKARADGSVGVEGGLGKNAKNPAIL